MDRSTKQAWLEGPGDLKEADVEDVPVKGQSVRVRSLPASFAGEAQSEASEVVNRGRDQIIKVNMAKFEALQFAQGVVEPQFTLAEAEQIAQKFGHTFTRVIEKIDELSAVDKDAIAEAEARFPDSGETPDGTSGGDGSPSGDDRSDIRTRTGA